MAVQIATGTENDFLNQLNIPTWEPKPEDSATRLRCLTAKDSTYGFNLKSFFDQKNAVLYKQRSGHKDASFSWDYYKYKGSLSKPPCSENVEWFVLENKISISQSQLDNLKKFGLNKFSISPDNIRHVQPMGDRIVEYYQAEICSPPKKETPSPSGEYNYIKASKQYTIYGMADQGVDLNTIFQKHGSNKKITIG